MNPSRDVQVVMVVRFRSRLPDDEVWRRCEERMPRFRELPGLVQKYYVKDARSGEWGGVYLWDSQDALQSYLASELRKTIASAYEAEGTPRVEILSVADALRK